MKRLLITLVISAAIVHFAQAGDFTYLTFRSVDGKEISFSVSQLKITFSNGQLVAENSETNQTISLSDLNKMYFTNSAVTNIEKDQPIADEAGVEVFTTAGVNMGRFSSLSQAKQTLSTGAYIVKQSDKTYKIAIK